MSGHCHGCGTYHEEDDDRLCAKCAANVAPATKRFPASENAAKLETTKVWRRLRDRSVLAAEWGEYDLEALLIDAMHAIERLETLHEKYAQERISRSRQTLSDNTKMENQ